MAYTTFTEVQGDFKDISFSATSLVKDTDVTQFIVEADALIDSYVGKAYEVPVTSGSGLSLLKYISRQLVSRRVKFILEVKQQGSREVNQNVQSGPSIKDLLQMLESIAAKKLDLDGATELLSAKGFYSSNYADSVEPVMKKDERQW